MRYLLPLIALSLTSFAANASERTGMKREAKLYTCTFTEPFISISFDAEYKQLSRELMEEMDNDEVTGETIYKRRVSTAAITKTGSNTFTIKNEKGNVVLSLTRDNKGSDGMSDYLFPFSAVLKSSQEDGNGLHGGCETDLQKRWLLEGGSR